tara:strand:- start:8450 stop:8683 length:234 start_codon:yes stop_codon:yes gene_type:complete
VSRKYVILTSSEAESIDFSQVLQTSADTLRWNNDESKTFVKYEGSKPRFLYGKDTLTYSQIRTELAKDEWKPEVPEE